MSLRFIPPPNAARYAVSMGGFFKVYRELGAAKLAVYTSYRRQNDMLILENVSGEWYVLFTVTPQMKPEDFPWKKDVRHYSFETHDYVTVGRRAVPMTREEYADWRLAVEAERRNVTVKVFDPAKDMLWGSSSNTYTR